jgi:hypothetical protein
MGSIADLVCLPALSGTFNELEGVRRDCKAARERLMAIRESLDRVLDDAFRRQCFGPLEHLFQKEEAAMAEYGRLAARLAAAEERWCAVRAALAYERDLLASGPVPRHRLN